MAALIVNGMHGNDHKLTTGQHQNCIKLDHEPPLAPEFHKVFPLAQDLEDEHILLPLVH
jgi:hypothetical protein